MFGSLRAVSLLLAAIILTGCAAAAGGEKPVALSGSAEEGYSMSDKGTPVVSETGIPPYDDAKATKTETATFALG
jgi:hypothetical protein